MISFIPDVDPRFFQGSDATSHVCQGCYVRPANHVHHKLFKGMGGRKGAAKKAIELPENKIELCLVCHEATHTIRSVTLDGFCCDACPRLKDCYYGARLLHRPYLHLAKPW